MRDYYTFPEIDLLTLQKQKVLSEAREVVAESDPLTMAMEAMDVIQAAETLLRMLEERGVKIDTIRKAVIAKNAARGYYGDGDAKH